MASINERIRAGEKVEFVCAAFDDLPQEDVDWVEKNLYDENGNPKPYNGKEAPDDD